MRFSVCIDPGRPSRDMLAMANYVENVGLDGVWTCDHFIPIDVDEHHGRGLPMLECWTTLAAIAQATSQVRIGTLVVANTFRHPAVVANMAATLDHVANGRFVLGLGAGGQANEHRAYGINLPPLRERFDRFEEACELIRSLACDPRTTYGGRWYQTASAVCEPKPLQQNLPILVAGGGEERSLRIAARAADEWHVWATPDVLARKNDVLDRRCEEIGRDPASIRRLTGADVHAGDLHEVARTLHGYGDARTDEFILRDDARRPLDSILERISEFATFVAPEHR